MVCVVKGYGGKPYDIDGRKGVSYKISVSCGNYPVDQDKGIIGSGEICETYKCDKLLVDSVEVGFVVNLNIDMSSLDKSGYYHVKSAMLRSVHVIYFIVFGVVSVLLAIPILKSYLPAIKLSRRFILCFCMLFFLSFFRLLFLAMVTSILTSIHCFQLLSLLDL